jgi:HlyD family secretion protein
MQKVKILLGLLIAGALIYGAVRYFNGIEEENARLALGTLERDRITLSATSPEIIVEQPIAEGSPVKKGDLLVRLDDTLQMASLHKVEADIAQQEANLDKVRNGARTEEIAAAEARVDTALSVLRESNRDLVRIQGIVAQRLAAQAELDTAETRRDANAARLRDAEAQLALLEGGSRVEDIAQAQAMLSATRALLAAEKQRLANLAITATIDGTLDSLPWNVGERVAMGAQVAVLLEAGAPYARVYIPETSRVNVNIGTTLNVWVDGVATPFAGNVRWISQEPAFTPYYALNDSERSRLVYLAEIQLPDSAIDLPAGLPAQVELP